MKRNRKKNRVKLSFLATILILSLAAVIAYAFSFNLPSYSIPSNLPPYGGPVGSYAPSGSLQVTFDNFSAIRAQNASAVLSSQLLNMANPPVKVSVDAVQARVIVTLVNATLKVNNTATVAFLSRVAFANLSQGFASSHVSPYQFDGFQLYNVSDSANGVHEREWVSLVDRDSAVLLAPGGGVDARSTISQMLMVRQGATPSILSIQNVTRMLYAVGGTDHLAFAIQNFPVQVLTSRQGVLAVDVVGGRVQVSNVVRFVSSGFASTQVAAVKAAYRYANDFSLYEECIRANEVFGFSSLREAVNLAGE